MAEPSSLPWSNPYCLGYAPSQGREQGQLDEPFKSETTIRQLENTHGDASAAFHRSLEHGQGSGNVQVAADVGQILDYNEEASFQQHSCASVNVENKKISWDDIVKVKHLVEMCIKSYMTKKEVIKTLSTGAKVEPSFTRLVWQRLEKENEAFFRNYYIWLRVKEQIMLFNQLLEQQQQLMMMEKTLEMQPAQLRTNNQLYPGSHEVGAPFSHQGTHLAQNCPGDRQVERVMQLPNYSQVSLYDGPSMRSMGFSQASVMPTNETYSTSLSMPRGGQFAASNIENFDGNGTGFLHMDNLEGMSGSLDQLSVHRRAPDLYMEFPSHQGSFSADQAFSSDMDAYVSQPFQPPPCDDRNMNPNTAPVYDSYGGS